MTTTTDGKPICVWSPEYEMDIGDHVFPTQKYRLIRESLLASGTFPESSFILPVPATLPQLQAVHTPEYLDDFLNLRRTDRTQFSELPLTAPIRDAFILAAGGSTVAARHAVTGHTAACHIGGGFHHSFAHQAEGFCYINDIAVAIRAMQSEQLITRAAVIDCDLHQGNGTAKIFLDDPDVFTFSIHQQNNYPEKEDSDLDVGLADYTDDLEYMAHLEDALPAVFAHKPQLIIYAAGADPYQDDVLGRLKLTMHGLAERDHVIISQCKQHNIPLVTVTAGGYAHHTKDTVAIHTKTCETVKQHYA